MTSYPSELLVDIDTVGMALPDLAAARAEALTRIRAKLKADATAGGRVNLQQSVLITDENGTVLDVVAFSEAIALVAA